MRRLLPIALGVALIALAASATPAAAATFKCTTAVSGGSFDKIVVPTDAICTLENVTVAGDVEVRKSTTPTAPTTLIMRNTTVGDDVEVKRDAFLQMSNSRAGDDVEGENALTVLVDTGSTVGDDIETHRTFQVFVFDSTVVEDIEVDRTTDQVFLCGNTVQTGDIEVERSGRDILVGFPGADCAGNTVLRDDIEMENNFTDVEFVISGNTVADDLEVFNNRGPDDPTFDVPKIVENNTGGEDLECEGNEGPVVASGNTFEDIEGQCVPPGTPVAAAAEATSIVNDPDEGDK